MVRVSALLARRFSIHRDEMVLQRFAFGMFASGEKKAGSRTYLKRSTTRSPETPTRVMAYILFGFNALQPAILPALCESSFILDLSNRAPPHRVRPAR